MISNAHYPLDVVNSTVSQNQHSIDDNYTYEFEIFTDFLDDFAVHNE